MLSIGGLGLYSLSSHSAVSAVLFLLYSKGWNCRVNIIQTFAFFSVRLGGEKRFLDRHFAIKRAQFSGDINTESFVIKHIL